jgi:hypothetical protein
MMWVDYNITQAGDHFKVEGDWPGEVMGVQKDGTAKDNWLYKPGDIYRVTKDGWLQKIGEEQEKSSPDEYIGKYVDG